MPFPLLTIRCCILVSNRLVSWTSNEWLGWIHLIFFESVAYYGTDSTAMQFTSPSNFSIIPSQLHSPVSSAHVAPPLDLHMIVSTSLLPSLAVQWLRQVTRSTVTSLYFSSINFDTIDIHSCDYNFKVPATCQRELEPSRVCLVLTVHVPQIRTSKWCHLRTL